MSIVPDFFRRRRGRGDGGGGFFDPFSLVSWDPFEGFPFNTSLASSSTFGGDAADFAGPCVDWKESPRAHVFKADLPGVKKEEVKVQVEDGRMLQISGERTQEQEETTDTWHRVERSSGRFLRQFRLPEDSLVDQVKASMENGVLTVTVPKVESKKPPNVKAIEISS